MSPGEISWLSNHLGHDVSTHKNNYRLHAPSIEITKVGKLLMAIDGGAVGYSGRQMTSLLGSDVEPDRPSTSKQQTSGFGIS